MRLRAGKLFLILLIPVALYGVAKGLLYYKAKSTVDEVVDAAANQADIRYTGISTDLRGAVTVEKVTIQPRGYQDTIGIESIELSSDDPMFFLRGADWQPGENAPPSRLAFSATGIVLPLSAEMLRNLTPPTAEASLPPDPDASAQAFGGRCARGMNIEPQFLREIGFGEVVADIDGRYRLDEFTHELHLSYDMDLRGIQSMGVEATLADVDVLTLGQGGMPQFSLGNVKLTLHVDPQFGRQALKACAAGSEQSVQRWSGYLAEKALAQFALVGLELGPGLQAAMRRFYEDWGEFSIEAKPAKPIGLLSLAFLPREQLADVLGLRARHNENWIADTSFSWTQPESGDLASLLGNAPAGDEPGAQKPRPKRIVVRREFRDVPVTGIAGFVDRNVKLKPRGQPSRQGVLKRIENGEAVVEQTLHGGKYTVYVPVDQIESAQALVEHRTPTR